MTVARKLMVLFLLILLFAVVYIGSYVVGTPDAGYSEVLNWVGQIGLALSILGFLLTAGKNRKGGGRQQHE